MMRLQVPQLMSTCTKARNLDSFLRHERAALTMDCGILTISNDFFVCVCVGARAFPWFSGVIAGSDALDKQVFLKMMIGNSFVCPCPDHSDLF